MALTGTVTWEIYQNQVYMNDKMLGPTVDPSALQGPESISLHWSITQIVFLCFEVNVVLLLKWSILCKIPSCW